MKAIINAQVITEAGILPERAILFNERIEAVVPRSALPQYAISEVIDAEGRYVAPGFIDVHVHGCGGYDTMDEAPEALTTIRRNVLSTGVTAFLPTTMTMSVERIQGALERIRAQMGQPGGATVLGCHMEGPFLNPAYKGAQDPQHIIAPAYQVIEQYLDVIKIVTLAPEMPGSQAFISSCCEQGIVVSMGHTNATYDEAKAAIEAGVSHATHLFNAMTGLTHRQPGVVGAALESDVKCELIVDNVHVHPAAQRIVYRLKGPDKLILITDAMRACLLGPGEYDLGGQMVTVKDNEARLASGVIAGSVLRLNQAVRNFRQNTGASIVEAVNLVSLNPARQLGMDEQKGSIEIGKDADLVIVDDEMEVYATIVQGDLLYRRE